MSPRGRYVLIARSLGGFFRAMLLGAWMSARGSKKMGVFMWQPNRRETLEKLSHLLDSGQVNPLVDRRYRLDQVPEAFRYLAAGNAQPFSHDNPNA